MILAGAKAIAVRAQTPSIGANIVSLKIIVKSSLFEMDIYCMLSGSFRHLQLKL